MAAAARRRLGGRVRRRADARVHEGAVHKVARLGHVDRLAGRATHHEPRLDQLRLVLLLLLDGAVACGGIISVMIASHRRARACVVGVHWLCRAARARGAGAVRCMVSAVFNRTVRLFTGHVGGGGCRGVQHSTTGRCGRHEGFRVTPNHARLFRRIMHAANMQTAFEKDVPPGIHVEVQHKSKKKNRKEKHIRNDIDINHAGKPYKTEASENA